MIDHEKVAPEIKAGIQALIDELNVHLSYSTDEHPSAMAMSILDYFTGHVIVSVADKSNTMSVADVVAMHSAHVREIAKRLDAILQGNKEHNRGQ